MLRAMFFVSKKPLLLILTEYFVLFLKAWRGPFFWFSAVGKRAGVLTCFSDSYSSIIRNSKRDVSGRVISLPTRANR